MKSLKLPTWCCTQIWTIKTSYSNVPVWWIWDFHSSPNYRNNHRNFPDRSGWVSHEDQLRTYQGLVYPGFFLATVKIQKRGVWHGQNSLCELRCTYGSCSSEQNIILPGCSICKENETPEVAISIVISKLLHDI